MESLLSYESSFFQDCEVSIDLSCSNGFSGESNGGCGEENFLDRLIKEESSDDGFNSASPNLSLCGSTWASSPTTSTNDQFQFMQPESCPETSVLSPPPSSNMGFCSENPPCPLPQTQSFVDNVECQAFIPPLPIETARFQRKLCYLKR